MTQTVFEPRTRTGPGFAQGYETFALSPPEVATPEGQGWVAAAGAIYSTASDLAKWDLALMSGKVLAPESYALMTTPRTLADGSSSGYGCGLAVSTRNDTTVLSHGGAVWGFRAVNTMIPASRSAVIVLSNFGASDAMNALSTALLSPLLPPKPVAEKVGASPKATSPETSAVPSIKGPPAAEAARLMFLSLQAGTVDRAKLGEEFGHFLTDEKIRGAATRLKVFGELSQIQVESLRERGGMEVARVRFVFRKGALKGLMYRRPDGKIEEFLVMKD
jgi:CubicO group peptidase (beta-lactamase class C family)